MLLFNVHPWLIVLHGIKFKLKYYLYWKWNHCSLSTFQWWIWKVHWHSHWSFYLWKVLEYYFYPLYSKVSQWYTIVWVFLSLTSLTLGRLLFPVTEKMVSGNNLYLFSQFLLIMFTWTISLIFSSFLFHFPSLCFDSPFWESFFTLSLGLWTEYFISVQF
jgi:hypothetical protein